eukprot:Gb_12144 [translate_table: standard]
MIYAILVHKAYRIAWNQDHQADFDVILLFNVLTSEVLVLFWWADSKQQLGRQVLKTTNIDDVHKVEVETVLHTKLQINLNFEVPDGCALKACIFFLLHLFTVTAAQVLSELHNLTSDPRDTTVAKDSKEDILALMLQGNNSSSILEGATTRKPLRAVLRIFSIIS